jgi:predicted nucleotidyltransferase/HEPN domain-containing protein
LKIKTSLPSQSQSHQHRLTTITSIIKEVIGNNNNNLASIVLFGSFARGDWVLDNYVEDGIVYEYSSDYDILVVLASSNNNKYYELKDQINQQLSIKGFDKKPLDHNHSVHIIIEPLKHLNEMLDQNHYFYHDIYTQGVMLYGNDKYQLHSPKKPNEEQRLGIAKENYEHCMKSGKIFLKQSKYAFGDEDYVAGTFLLHQATESFFHCALLVFTGYKHKIHDIDNLKKRCCSFAHQFLTIFPAATQEQQKCYDLLRESYIDARYNKNFQIDKKQLEYLIKRVEKLREATKEVCFSVVG